ncbi:hypothetical protein PK98_01570 [Croceibacterium mercuriale]|uniref:Uncharacterized protein n=2 Tax=Croceibacterium mercuriale TaxID=1572751 RepID=A0A0B2BYH6_9SPHN|nr:hypothetical protein PK98_01570 [Croceibacterium mercuriale]
MVIPQRGIDGQRVTVNSNLDENETLWHFRSAWNVAALNCSEDAAFAPVTEQYGKFLTGNARRLTAANNAIDQKFRRANNNDRRAAIRDREEHMTSVYNFFASPGARASFCQEALNIANEAAATPPTDVDVFASAGLARYLAVFEGFFQEYEGYQTASRAWDSQYGARYGASQPGYVAIYGSGEPSVATSLADASQPVLAGTVTDETGATIPIIAVPAAANSSPVVQPVANDAPAN